MSSKAVAPETERLPARDATGIDIERDIALVVAFLNTCDAETSTDVLDEPAAWRQWCLERGLGEAPEPDETRAVRDTMRGAVSCGTGLAPAIPAAWPVRVTLHGGIPALTGTDALGTTLSAAVHLVHTGHWDRLKICPADNCLWAFYDRSRNRSRTWCSMRVCGNREKARSWRERHWS